MKYSYQPSVPEGATDTLVVHAAAIAASDSQSKISTSVVEDLTRDLENISIFRDADDQARDLLVEALEDDSIPDSIVLDSRINEESLSKFRPSANLSSRPRRHSRPDRDSQPVDKTRTLLPNEEDESKKARKLSNSTKDCSSPSAIEQSLVTAFEGIQIGSLKATVKAVETNGSKPKVLIKPETSSRLASGSAVSTIPATLTSKATSEHSKQKAIVHKV